MIPLLGFAMLAWTAWQFGIWTAIGVAILGTIMTALLMRGFEQIADWWDRPGPGPDLNAPRKNWAPSFDMPSFREGWLGYIALGALVVGIVGAVTGIFQ